jgi:hypothetical protein
VLRVLIPDLAVRLADDAVGKERLFAALDGLDALVKVEEIPTNAMLLCAMLAPFLLDVIYDVEGRIDPFAVLDERARPILESMRASRRDTERARQILLAQRRLLPSKRRRSRPMTLVRRDWFDEALALFELLHPQAEGELADEIARWHRLRRDGHANAAAAPAADGDPQAQAASPGGAQAPPAPSWRPRPSPWGRRERLADRRQLRDPVGRAPQRAWQPGRPLRVV